MPELEGKFCGQQARGLQTRLVRRPLLLFVTLEATWATSYTSDPLHLLHQEPKHGLWHTRTRRPAHHGKIAGIAIRMGAPVGGHAQAGEVIVFSTFVAGSGNTLLRCDGSYANG